MPFGIVAYTFPDNLSRSSSLTKTDLTNGKGRKNINHIPNIWLFITKSHTRINTRRATKKLLLNLVRSFVIKILQIQNALVTFL